LYRTLYSKFLSSWLDNSNKTPYEVEPGFHIPYYYSNVKASPPAYERTETFAEEILFYMFYTSTHDISQIKAAQELFKRNWRFHKELGLWLTSRDGMELKGPECFTHADIYTFFDPTSWRKIGRQWHVIWETLEGVMELNTSSNQ
jgi:CCR4-NOT transcription complex subunit 2